MIRFIASIALGLGGIAICVIAGAQPQGPIVTDRPSFSASTNVVGDGVWQLETGYLYTRSSGNASSQSIPNAWLRFGLSDDVEIRLGWVGYTRSEAGPSSDSGFSDVKLSVKWQLTDPAAATRFTFVGDLSVPAGDDAFSSDSYDPSLSLAWAHSGSLEWFGMATFSSVDGSDSLSNGIGLSFAISDTSSWFVEYQMAIPESGSTAHNVNLGLVFLSSQETQFDLNGSVGLNDSAADYAIGVGWARRF